jgi:small subunit ribosomal protein S16
MKRTGTRNNACYRIVVADQRASRDGKAIETIGFYDPKKHDERIDMERADYWLEQGAVPSETVETLIKRIKDGKGKTAENWKPKMKAAARKKLAEKEAAAKEKPAEEAPVEASAEA